jgi:hypothetical protein
MAASNLYGDVTVQGDLTVTGDLLPAINRTDLATESLASFEIPWTAWRVWDAFSTNLPGTAATDDLALIGGTFGTNAPSIQAGDLKAAGATTRYARCSVQVPYNFVTGGTVKIRAHAGMKTTAADTSCTIDFSLYLSNEEDGVGSDLVTTAATTINNTTEVNADFTVDSTTLLPGSWVDIRMAINCTDGATVTAVIPFVGSCEMLYDVQG